METGEGVEIFVKTEKVDVEIEQISENTLHNKDSVAREEEVWIKPEAKEDPQVSETGEQSQVEVAVGLELKEVKEELSQDADEQNADSSSKLPLKKRKLSGEDDVSMQKEKAKDDTENGERNEQSEAADEDKPKEKYLMYSYEITKNIQIVTITEEERQVEHLENVNSRRHMRYVCEDCAQGFVLKEAYSMHMKVHSKEAGDFECDLCHSRLKTADILYRHKLRHYRRYRCLLCWTRFRDKDSAACHVMTEHIKTAFECDYCGRGFKRPQYLKRHVEQLHTKPHRLECAVCLRVFHERSWYRSHIRTHNEELRLTVKLPVSCAECGRTFKNKSCLKRHAAAHSAEGVACPRCQLACKNRHVLGQHYLAVHHEEYDGAPEVTCRLCSRVCATRAMLKRHMRRMHSDRTKKYQCDHCQRYYLTKGEVRAHIAWSHAPGGARSGHACPCGRVFRSPSLLRDHTARFHEQQPPPRNHECEHCGKAFSNKQVLNRHKKSHSNEMYPCKECGLLFKTQPYVKVHYQLKHLNMTRAQINAQRKLNKQNRIAQNNLHVQPNWEPSINNKKQPASVEDPLLVQDTDISIKVERASDEGEGDELNVPLFETFVDVNRN